MFTVNYIEKDIIELSKVSTMESEVNWSKCSSGDVTMSDCDEELWNGKSK